MANMANVTSAPT